ncbi:hypothetical protein Tco_0978685 [Tanacetum coccineum]|uniref:Uncharacterized protein n=1 Tax=Tanacetum coccineum TaxID=301880 RepID=A0ABQ5ENK6_9ASTR
MKRSSLCVRPSVMRRNTVSSGELVGDAQARLLPLSPANETVGKARTCIAAIEALASIVGEKYSCAIDSKSIVRLWHIQVNHRNSPPPTPYTAPRPSHLFYTCPMPGALGMLALSNIPYLSGLGTEVVRFRRKQGATIASNPLMISGERLEGLTVIVRDLLKIDMDELICEELDDTEGAPDVVEGDQAISAPVLGPQPPPTARTISQRLARLKEDVHGIQVSLGDQRKVVDAMARDFSRFTVWAVEDISHLLDSAGATYVRYSDTHVPYQEFLNMAYSSLWIRRPRCKEIDEVGEVLIIWNPMCDYFAVLEDMDAYRDKGMGDVIFGKPFLKEVGINARWLEGMITIYNGNEEVTYQMDIAAKKSTMLVKYLQYRNLEVLES